MIRADTLALKEEEGLRPKLIGEQYRPQPGAEQSAAGLARVVRVPVGLNDTPLR